MNIFKKTIASVLCVSLFLGLFTGCVAKVDEANNSETSGSQTNQNSSSSVTKINTSEMFSNRDKEIGYAEADCVIITLNDDNIQVDDSSGVEVNDSTVIISDEGSYILKGNISNGQILVDAEKTDKIKLILEGVSIENESTAPIYVKQADKVYVTIAGENVNTLSTNGEFTVIDENNIDAVIYSKEDLTLNGEGMLSISADYGNGITSKDDLIFTGGNYEMKVSGYGLEGKNSVRIANGSFKIISGKDSIHSENSEDTSLGFIYIADGKYDITAETDGIDANTYIQIDGGNFNIITGGGSENVTLESKDMIFPSNNEKMKPNMPPHKQTDIDSNIKSKRQPDTQTNTQPNAPTDTQSETTTSSKGIKCDGNININKGSFNINSFDDSIHSNSNIIINDGTYKVSSGDDGIHADSNIKINGGKIDIIKSYEGIEGESIDITGGELVLLVYDDGFNAAGDNEESEMGGRSRENMFAIDENAYIKISGGKIRINASGDGIDSNGNVYVTGGETYVSGSINNGNSAMDYNGEAKISGGIFVATGASGMAQNFGSNSTQGSILTNTQSMQNGVIMLQDSTGKELVCYTPEKDYNSVVISTPDIKKDEVYKVETNDESKTIEMTNLIYGSGEMVGKIPNRPNKGNMEELPKE